MMRRSLFVSALLAASACAGDAPVPATRSARARPPIVEAGGVSREVLNGVLLHNGNVFTRMAMGSLAGEGLADSAEIQQILGFNPYFGVALKYLVECALPEGRAVTVPTGTTSLELHGALGLAADWEGAACDEACQEWVSACLFARTNVYGLPVQIYLAGPHPALGEDEVDPGFNLQEGSFYGNFFLDQPREYACRGSGYDPLFNSVRVCTQHGQGCGFTRVGTCRGVDGDTGLPSDRRACDGETPSGVPIDCWSRATLPGLDVHPEPSTRYTRVVTIYVRPSMFAPGKAAVGFGTPAGPVACGDVAPPPAPSDPDPDPGPAVAGTRCFTDDRCDSAQLICDNVSPQPRCTSVCTDNPLASVEQAACGGPGSTCLAVSEDQAACVQACDPVGTGGAVPRRCDQGGVCTRMWLYQSDTVAGCYNFCQTPADCGGQPCHVRTGACGETVDETLLPDGQPCDPTSPVAACRGACLPVTATVTQGLCASYINTALRQRCYDGSPAVLPPLSPGAVGAEDDLSVCAYRVCRMDADCPAPLRCRDDVLGGFRVCAY